MFEAASLKLPTVFYSDLNIDIYKNQFSYPINTLKNTLKIYNDLKVDVYHWYKKYYEPLNQNKWLKIVRQRR